MMSDPGPIGKGFPDLSVLSLGFGGVRKAGKRVCVFGESCGWRVREGGK